MPRPARGESLATPPQDAALFARRRALLATLSGGVLGRLPRPDPAPRRDPVLTLVNRITQGFNQPEYERARALGYEAYLEEQLDHLSIDDSVMDARLATWPTLNMSPKELYDAYSANFTEPYFQFKGAALARSTDSRRQLFERMCEFWNDHFSIDHNKGGLEWAFLPEHDRTVIRPHALGSFPEMLSACAFGGAMLYYLDNWLNVRGAPQANYARELLELHTLGVHGGYNEFDVTEVARCFTGWTLETTASSPDWMRGKFEPHLHAPGMKNVLGNTIPFQPPVTTIELPGSHDAKRVLQIVSAHPSTAQFLARKLIRWFLTPTPPQVLVDRVAQTYLDTKGDIKSMLRVILARENLGALSGVLSPKFRRPFHFMTSLFRTFDVIVRNPTPALSFLGAMGHMPFDHVQPDGYPDDVNAWGDSLLPRWDFANIFLAPFFGGFSGLLFVSIPELRARIGYHVPSDRPGLAGRMNAHLFGSSLSPHEEDVLQQFIDTYPATFDLAALFDCMALGASLPGFQWY